MPASFVAAIVGRPVTVVMVTIAVLVFGWVGATRLPVELLPNVAYPTLTIQTEFPDAAPSEVEQLITRPIEERVRAVPGVLHVESTSKEGRSEIVLDFAWGTRIDTAMAEVREKLDRAVLPPEATRPLVLRFDPSQEPILRLALHPAGSTGTLAATDLTTLRHVADTTVQRALEKLPGVAAVQIYGGEEHEVLVELDPERLAALAIDAEEVVAAIQRDNVNDPGGALTDRKNRYLIRTVHEAKSAADIAGVIVRARGDARLRVRDVATVRLAPREAEVLSLVDERDAIELAIYREGDA
ncbi:MAG TPA: efflux RND transporter permease subunit, partial [Microbacterium sp.]|nr:efflux RND transporter permease subunit [Microbacterium sp.]